MKLFVINGPNINMLGIREQSIYGSENYVDLCNSIIEYANEKEIEIELFQSNHEGAIVDYIQKLYGVADGIIINPAAFTHTSVAILDALKAVDIDTVEVHISDVSKREEFRQVSYIRSYCIDTISGYGIKGYTMAMDVFIARNKGVTK